MTSAPATTAQLQYATRLQAELREMLARPQSPGYNKWTAAADSRALALLVATMRPGGPDYRADIAAAREADAAAITAAEQDGTIARSALAARGTPAGDAQKARSQWITEHATTAKRLAAQIAQAEIGALISQQVADADVDLTTLDRAEMSAYITRRTGR